MVIFYKFKIIVGKSNLSDQYKNDKRTKVILNRSHDISSYGKLTTPPGAMFVGRSNLF